MPRTRITNADLDSVLTLLNDWADRNGQPGYYIDGAYGGVKLVQYISHDSTAIRNVSTQGYGTKRELYEWMWAYLAGIRAADSDA